MKILRFNLFLITSSIILFANIANANRYYIGDYAIDIMWKYKGDYLKVWGGISGGHSCEKVKLSIFFENTEDNTTRKIYTYIKNYRSMGRNNYKAKAYIPERSKKFHNKKKHWMVTDYELNCVK